MSRLCRYACGLACLVAVLALVACGAGPGSTKQADPKAIGNKTLEVGKSLEIPLGDKFIGADLTYKAESDKPTVATAVVDNNEDILTITAISAGKATITVTAKNSQGEAKQPPFTVTVPKPEEEDDEEDDEDDEEEEEAPTVRTGARTSASVAQGGTQTVTLSTVFTGANLSYDVSSSADTVATASESNGTLTITGVSSGPATITIVATNDAGSVEHEIDVTVSAPATTTPTPTPTNNPSNCDSPLEIHRDDHEECTLPNDHSLVYSVPDGEQERVRVNGPDSSETKNVWTITAIRKGRPVVQIRDDDTGNTVGEITVVVPNSPPRLEDADGVLSASPEATSPPTPITLTSAAPVAPQTISGLHTATLTAIVGAFTDEDDVDKSTDTDTSGNGIFNYKVQHKPDELLITTVRGFILEENSAVANVPIEAVVLKPFTEEFSIEVYAYDLDNDQSDHPITVNFSAGASVRSGTYAVKQKENGDLEPVRVGNRLSIPGTVVKHTLQFHDAAGIDRAAFQFASNLNGTLTKQVSGKAYLATAPNHDAAAVALCGGPGPNTNTVPDKESLFLGTGCYTYTTTNRVEIPAHTDFVTGTEPQIGFILPSKTNGLNSGSATITIKYYVRAYSARHVHGDDDNPIPADAATRIHTASEPLRINIHKCIVTTDCPIE